MDVGRGRCAAEVYSVKCCCGWPAGAKEYRPIGIVINIKALRAASGWSGAVAAWRLDVWTAVVMDRHKKLYVAERKIQGKIFRRPG